MVDEDDARAIRLRLIDIGAPPQPCDVPKPKNLRPNDALFLMMTELVRQMQNTHVDSEI
jgi:hypothetical protein